jgi:hypothetical protein
MKKYLYATLIGLLFFGCSKDDNGNGNPFLPNVSFDTGNLINTNLPQFSDLQFPGNSIIVNGFGVKGLMLANTGSSVIAFERSDPNHAPSNCSAQSLSGLVSTCNCNDGNSYSLGNGLQTSGEGGYPLAVYRTETSGSIIRVFN